jgi:putative transposase
VCDVIQVLTSIAAPHYGRRGDQRKGRCAPWWGENSKEAYNTGLDGLARGLEAWSASRRGQRAGKPANFPRFKTAHAQRTVRFTTGTIRVESDRHHLTLPRVGTIRTHESTRKLSRRLEIGTARILSATVTQDRTGRWYCSFQTLVATKTRPAHAPNSRNRVVGVDVGVTADNLLVVATPNGTEVVRVGAPASLSAAQRRLRIRQRRAARQHGPYDPATQTNRQPSKRWRRTQSRIGRIHAHAAAVRRDVLHKATTALAQQHQVVVVETLNASGMRTRGGAHKRGLNRALANAALAEFRRMLDYKTRWYGSHLVAADRFYPSSKTCSTCGGRKPSLPLAERIFDCDGCGLRIDRDLNAAINLARLGEPYIRGEQGPAGSGPVAGRGATQETELARAGDAAGDEASTPHHQPVDQTGTASPQGEAA